MAFNSTIKGTEIPAVAEAYKCMSDASLRIKEFIRLKNPDKSEIDEEGRELFNVAVTVGGTWQKRGHTSKIGVVFVESVDTGRILDF